MKVKSFSLNVPPYLKKYLEGKYPLDDFGRIRASKTNMLGAIVMMSLQVVNRPRTLVFDRNKAFVTLRYYDDLFYRQVPSDKYSHLQRCLDDMFRTDLISFVNGRRKGSESFMIYIIEFFAAYCIDADEDGLSFDAARKIIRDASNKNIFSVNRPNAI